MRGRLQYMRCTAKHFVGEMETENCHGIRRLPQAPESLDPLHLIGAASTNRHQLCASSRDAELEMVVLLKPSLGL